MSSMKIDGASLTRIKSRQREAGCGEPAGQFIFALAQIHNTPQPAIQCNST
jgi:hypothetical protein